MVMVPGYLVSRNHDYDSKSQLSEKRNAFYIFH